MEATTKEPEKNDSGSAKELQELHVRVLKRVRGMSIAEGFQTLIDSGIYTTDGKLAKEYGGA